MILSFYTQIISWAITVVLAILFISFIILAVAFWRKGTTPTSSRNKTKHDPKDRLIAV